MYEGNITALMKSYNVKSDLVKNCDCFHFKESDLKWLEEFYKKNYFGQPIKFNSKYTITVEGMKEFFLVRSLDDSYIQIDCLVDMNNPKIKMTQVYSKTFKVRDETYVAECVYSRVYEEKTPVREKKYSHLSGLMVNLVFMGTIFCNLYGMENLERHKLATNKKKYKYYPKPGKREGYVWIHSFKRGNTCIAGYWRKKK